MHLSATHSGVHELLICCSEASVLTGKECLYVYRNRHVAVLAFDRQLDGVQNYCFRALYRYSLHQHTTPKYKLKMSKNDPSELQFVWITQSLFSRFSNSLWSCSLGPKALVKTCFLILLFLHPASLYTSRHSWCRYNNLRDLSDWHIILLALCIVAFIFTKYLYIYIYIYNISIQVHINKIIWWKVHFFLVTCFKKWNFHVF